jgi:hypothetical protein
MGLVNFEPLGIVISGVEILILAQRLLSHQGERTEILHAHFD